MPTLAGDVVGQRRWYWPAFAGPGLIWLILLFLTPFYAIMAVAFGGIDQIFGAPVPAWNPADWSTNAFSEALRDITSGDLRPVFIRTVSFILISVAACIAIGYPVAYYIARHAGRWKVLLLTLMIAPFWMSYLMRMLAWVNLLNNDPGDPGLVNQALIATPLFDNPINFATGDVAAITIIFGLIYGYIPFFILPLYAALDRIDKAQLEASRDMGASPRSTFWRVTLPLSKQGILAGSVIIMLPMFGDYYTPDLLAPTPAKSLLGNAINRAIHTRGSAPFGASLTLLLSAFVAILMLYYLLSVAKATRASQQ